MVVVDGFAEAEGRGLGGCVFADHGYVVVWM